MTHKSKECVIIIVYILLILKTLENSTNYIVRPRWKYNITNGPKSTTHPQSTYEVSTTVISQFIYT